MDYETVSKMTVGEIRTELKKHKLAIYGTKQMLIDRLVTHLNKLSTSTNASNNNQILNDQYHTYIQYDESKIKSKENLSYNEFYLQENENDKELDYHDQIRRIEELERLLIFMPSQSNENQTNLTAVL